MSTIGKFTIPWQTLSLNICLLLSLISYNKNRNKNPTWDHRTPSSLVFENNLFCNFIVERNSIVVVATTTPIRMFLKLHTLFTRIALRFTRNQWIGSSKLYCFEAALQSGLKPRPDESGWKYAVSKVSGFMWTGLQMHHSVTFGKFYHVSCMPRWDAHVRGYKQVAAGFSRVGVTTTTARWAPPRNAKPGPTLSTLC